MDVTLGIALWGAVLATLVAFWDFAKWMRSGARLRISVRPNVHYPDSPVVDEPSPQPGVLVKRLKPSFHIEIVNAGDLPTTLIAVEACYTKTGWLWKRQHDSFRLSWGSDVIQAFRGNRPPVLLGPGELWSARIDQEMVLAARDNPGIRKLDFLIEVRASHCEKKIVKKAFGPKHDFISAAIPPPPGQKPPGRRVLFRSRR